MYAQSDIVIEGLTNPMFWVLVIAVATAYFSGKIDFCGALTGGICVGLLMLGFGWLGMAMMAVFFLLGTAASSWKIREKQQKSLAQEAHGRRSVVHVLANGGVGAICGILVLLFPTWYRVWEVMMAASFAAALSDTWSSELGNIYGSHFVNVLTFKMDRQGKDGVISLEGTLWGLVGSVVIAMVYGVFRTWDEAVVFISMAGVAGNIADSVLGATLQRAGAMNNHSVNFANTCIASLTAGVLYWAFG